MKDLLIKLNACQEAREWAGDKTWEEVYITCHRGDWLLWLFARTNPDDLQLLTLAKGHCVNTVRHLMEDTRSIKAVDTAIAFGEGRATREELDAAAAAAADAADAAFAAAAAAADAADAAFAAGNTASAAAADAAFAAGNTASAAAYAAAAAAIASAYASAYDAAYAARRENQRLTADICRKYLPIKVWNIKQQDNGK